MAAFTTTITEKRPTAGTPSNRTNVTFTRTFTYTIATGATSGDTAALMTVPAGVAVVGVYQKASTSTLTGTLAYDVGGTSIVAAAAVTSTTSMVGATMAALTAPAADATLSVTLAGTQPGGTITVSFVCTDVGAQSATYTTYTT